jgi:hypothetical protein
LRRKKVENCPVKQCVVVSEEIDRIAGCERKSKEVSGCFYNSDFIEVLESDSAPCLDVIDGFNDIGADRANVIFIGHGYQSALDVKERAKAQVEKLLEIEPFSEYKDRLNFWVVNEVGSLSECEERLMYPMIEESKYLHCPTNLADKCPALGNQFVNNIINDEAFGLDYRSRASSTVEGIVFLEDGTLMLYDSNLHYYGGKFFAHEFGHSFGKLHDEYTESTFSGLFENFPNPISLNGPNCFSTFLGTSRSQCLQNAAWKDMIGNGCGEDGVVDCDSSDPDFIYEVGCFEGCFYFSTGSFRPTLCSLMNDRCSEGEVMYPDYGPVNEHFIEQRLLQYSG